MAAVAGLAALAVVLVQNVVRDTAEQISSSSARGTAAKVAAAEITRAAFSDSTKIDQAARGAPSNAAKADLATAEAARLIILYQNRCENIKIIYSDIPGLQVDWKLKSVTIGGGNQAAIVASIKSNWSDNLDEPDEEGCVIVGV